MSLEKMTPVNLERVYRTVIAIEEELQLNGTPDLTINAIRGSQTQDYQARENALKFLQYKGVVKTFESKFLSEAGIAPKQALLLKKENSVYPLSSKSIFKLKQTPLKFIKTPKPTKLSSS